jgi:hypothetical protein
MKTALAERKTPAGMHGHSWKPGAAASRWHPGAARPPFLGQSQAAQEVGLSMLSALSVASVWSSVCPSYFTFSTFASQPAARQRALTTCWIGFGLSSLAAVSIWFIFGEFVPALVAEGTALALLGISLHAINSKPPEGVPPMEKQQAVAQA